MSSCCPLIDGSGGGGPTPPTPVTCANTVLVQSLADLPAPAGSLIPLAPNTLYKICGTVNLGSLTLDLPASSVLSGDDPLVDGVVGNNGTTVQALEGGTIRDLVVAQIAGSGAAIAIGSLAPGANWTDCVLWNLSTSCPGGAGVTVVGSGTFLSIARLLDRNSAIGVRIGTASGGTSVAACNIDNQVYVPPRGVPGTAVEIDATAVVINLALTESALSVADPLGFGYHLLGLVNLLRVASCAFSGSGTPSVVAQPGLPPATIGSAIQAEAVGCVGFETPTGVPSNSAQRGSIQIQNALTPIPAPGIPVPVGTPAGPTFVLDPSSVRVSLDGATGPTQQIRFDRIAPYSAEITVSISVQVAVGFTFTPRVIVCGVSINGVPTPLQFAGTTPDFTSAAPVSISFVTPATLSGGDLVQLFIANATDAANLDVLAARITIT